VQAAGAAADLDGVAEGVAGDGWRSRRGPLGRPGVRAAQGEVAGAFLTPLALLHATTLLSNLNDIAVFSPRFAPARW
jgi:hypothetical protein